MDQEIFKKVSREDERVQLFVDLASAMGEVLCKGKNDSLVKLKAVHWHSKSMHLECLLESQEALANGEDFLGYFFLGGEKYYFEAKATVYQNSCQFQLPAEVFHLQRRQNYRVRIPESYAIYFDVSEINETPVKIHARLADLSSQGCRLIEKGSATPFKIGDKLEGHLAVKKNAPVKLSAEVRHLKNEDGSQMVGLEFTGLSPILENNLFALTLEIHKEVFRR